MPDSWWLWLLLAALALALVAGLVGSWVASPTRRRQLTGRSRPHRDSFRAEAVESPPRRAVLILNPAKVDDPSATRSSMEQVFAEEGWAPPTWLETSREEPGLTQAQTACEWHPDLICAIGGDGTLRAVAEGMLDSGIPMGVIPLGTGNLFARNLRLPAGDLTRATRIALTGRNQPVDVGWAEVDRDGDGSVDHAAAFLVMAGMGMDAETMRDAPEELKTKWGWPAYVVSGARNLLGESFRVSITGDEVERVEARTRAVVVGNCGELTGGIALMPEAELTDGQLNAVIVSPKSLAGWAAVVGQVLSGSMRRSRQIRRLKAPDFVLRADSPVHVQLDGDYHGEAIELRLSIRGHALVVRIGNAPLASLPDPGAPDGR